MEYCTLAADQGNANAQFNVGVMYKKGQGVPQDYPKSMKYFTLAAEQGDAQAQYFLGSMHNQGAGVQKDCLPDLLDERPFGDELACVPERGVPVEH